MANYAINWAKRVKQGYDRGFYTVDDVYYFYQRKRIIAEEFENITNISIEEYEANK